MTVEPQEPARLYSRLHRKPLISLPQQQQRKTQRKMTTGGKDKRNMGKTLQQNMADVRGTPGLHHCPMPKNIECHV